MSGNILWNEEEKRLRWLLRLVVHLVVTLVLLAIANTPVILLAAPLRLQALYPGQPLERLLANREALQSLAEDPIILALSAVVTTIVVIVTLWLAGRFLDKRVFIAYGLDFLEAEWWSDLIFGLFLGALLMGIIFGVELALGWVSITDTFVTSSGQPFFLAFLAPLILFVCVGIYEEMISRGYHLLNMAEGFGNSLDPIPAIAAATILSSIIFGLMHVFNPNASVISTINLCVAGIFLATGFILTRRLALPIGLHITWNLFQGNIFGFPVSGGDFASTSVIAIAQGGPSLLTGGAFGPEAGIIGLAAMLLGMALIVLYVRLRNDTAGIDQSLAQYSVEDEEPDTFV